MTPSQTVSIFCLLIFAVVLIYLEKNHRTREKGQRAYAKFLEDLIFQERERTSKHRKCLDEMVKIDRERKEELSTLRRIEEEKLRELRVSNLRPAGHE